MNMVSANTTEQMVKQWQRGEYTIRVFLEYYDEPANGKYMFKLYIGEQQVYNSNVDGIEMLSQEQAIKMAEQKIISMKQEDDQEQYYDQRLDAERNQEYM